jgi:60 kDa SS-A/Ro ribonucleoprotein
MANKSLFASASSRLPAAKALNQAGGRAYALPPKQALAQIAATGCFNGTYYSSAESQLQELQSLIVQVNDPLFLAKLAIYSRERALMKDMPAALLLALSKLDTQLMQRVFDRVIDNGRVLRTMFQLLRSGLFERRSLSSSLQRAFQRWFNTVSVEGLLSASIGHDPSLRDVLRLARPTPKDNARRAMFGWLTGKAIDKWAPATAADLPEVVQALEAFRRAETAEDQVKAIEGKSVRWDLLADQARGSVVWKVIARQMGPQALRMNLNTLLRHEVFGPSHPAVNSDSAMLGKFTRMIKDSLGLKARQTDREMIEYVAGRLQDADEIRRSRQFPYQYFAAYLNADPALPHEIKSALHRAAELACGNVPELAGPVVIGLDVSGSMASPVTGNRGAGATSKMRCVDAAALFAAAILRRNPESVVIPFDTKAYGVRIDPQDSILSLAERLAKYGGGGTDCSLPLAEANTTYGNRSFAGCILVSDNESWVGQGRAGSTAVMTEWKKFVQNQLRLGGHEIPAPKLVCIDLQPNTTTQAPERQDILNVGGFSDAVFSVVSGFLGGDANRFVKEVEAVEIQSP